MNFQKIDLELASALADTKNQQKTLLVFIHTTHIPNKVESVVLKKLGVYASTSKYTIFTANLAKTAIRGLSQQPWIKSISLSRKLKLKQN